MCQIGDQYTRSIIQAHLRQRRSDRIGIAEDAPDRINRVASRTGPNSPERRNPASKRKLLESSFSAPMIATLASPVSVNTRVRPNLLGAILRGLVASFHCHVD